MSSFGAALKRKRVQTFIGPAERRLKLMMMCTSYFRIQPGCAILSLVRYEATIFSSRRSGRECEIEVGVEFDDEDDGRQQWDRWRPDGGIGVVDAETKK